YLQPWQFTITVVVRSLKGCPSASTPVTVSGTACTIRVLRRFCVPGSLDSADSFTQASGEQFLRVALCSGAGEQPCAIVRKGNFGMNRSEARRQATKRRKCRSCCPHILVKRQNNYSIISRAPNIDALTSLRRTLQNRAFLFVDFVSLCSGHL